MLAGVYSPYMDIFPILYSKTESQITLLVSFSFLKFYQSRTLKELCHDSPVHYVSFC